MVQSLVVSRSFQYHLRSSQGHFRPFYEGIFEKTLKFSCLWAHCLLDLASSDIIYPIFDSEEDRLLLAAQKVGPKVVQIGPTPPKNSEKSGFYSIK